MSFDLHPHQRDEHPLVTAIPITWRKFVCQQIHQQCEERLKTLKEPTRNPKWVGNIKISTPRDQYGL